MAIDMSGKERISAPIERVWQALNDPAILERCIPGCERLVAERENAFSATVTIKIGPIKARFLGEVELSNIDAPHSCTITGEGKGGVAGFAKGGADVTLHEEAPGVTVLTYDARADIGGKLAQLGSRMIQSTSRKLAGEFFGKFNETVSSD